MRLELDVRRVWRCPECGREIRTEGLVVAKVCGCKKDGVLMRLLELPCPKPTVRIPAPSTPDPDVPELADFPTDLPVNPAIKKSANERPPSEDFPLPNLDQPTQQIEPQLTEDDAERAP